ncbi:hypothetical protein JMM81_13975 [Bacillus sp. V3B]|uniref:DUF6273 domain-containing protein n=1 Tax=Bacillus sp. V3B TaxID=2804915 RepID=UPI00210F1C7C|nr:DUF6273 domain-containing protein [Bacillus sp. V3B]MCQ6276045.1 hypothetical protein [Bacillus sp. V3B]
MMEALSFEALHESRVSFLIGGVHSFYDIAFSDVEKELINTTHCTDNGEDTEDKVFLLSVNELKGLSGVYGKSFFRAVGTDFAKLKKADGCN